VRESKTSLKVVDENKMRNSFCEMKKGEKKETEADSSTTAL